MQKVIRTLQIQNAQLLARVQDVEAIAQAEHGPGGSSASRSNIANAGLQSHASSTPRSNDTNEEGNDGKAKLKNEDTDERANAFYWAGQCFVIMYSPWLPGGRRFFKLRLDPSYNPANRWKDANNQAQGLLREYIAIIPAGIQRKDVTKSDIDNFILGMNGIRAAVIHRVKTYSLPIFGLRIALLLKSRDNEELDRLSNAHNPKHMSFPLLYENEEPSKENMFRHESLMKILRGWLHGPKSIGNPTVQPLSGVNSSNWKVSEVTPGALALAAIASRFVLAREHEFSLRCGKNRLELWVAHNKYKEAAERLLRSRTGQETLKIWNSAVFPKQTKNGNNKSGDQDDEDDEFRRLM